MKSDFGGDTIACGYFNDDKYGDILIGGYSGGRNREGRVYLYYGAPKDSMNTICDHTFTGEASMFGAWFSVGEINGDKCDDLVVSAGLRRSNTDDTVNRVYIYYTKPFPVTSGDIQPQFVTEIAEDVKPISSLHEAAKAGNIDQIKSLIKKGANINSLASDTGMMTPLHEAAIAGHKDVVEILLDHGARVDALDNMALTPLHCAAKNGHTDIAGLLIERGANVSSKDLFSATALHNASQKGHREIMELLIAKGADVNAKNYRGRSPLDVVGYRNHREIAKLLAANGTKTTGQSILQRFQSMPEEEREKLRERMRQRFGGNNRQRQDTNQIHDTGIVDVAAPASCKQGESISVAVTLDNHGDHDESCSVRLSDDRNDLQIASQMVTLNSKHWEASKAHLIFDSEPEGICHFGNWLAEGDVNGDGIKDLLVSASHWPNDTYKGRVYLYYGGANMDATADKTFTGENAFDRFGDNSGFIADLNNDGFGDVIISAPDYNGEGPEFNGDGRVYIYFGGTDMNDKAADLILDPPEGGGGFFGYRVTAGDFNDDGWLDLVVPAVIWNDYTGRVYLYYGPVAADTAADKIFAGEGPGNVFGAYPSAGDIDDDGYDDLLLTNRYYPDLKSDTRGRGYLYWGARGTSMSEIPALIFDPPELGTPTPEFGTSNAVKDIDNDNFADVIIGARHCNSYDGKAYLYWGKSRASFTTTPDMTLAAESNAQLGGSVRIAHVDGDRYRDIVLGGWNYNSQQGRFYLYSGNAQGDMDVRYDSTFDGQEKGFDAFQHIVADFNGDGYGDLAVGGTGYSNDAGRVLLWYGPFSTSTNITFTWDTTNASIGKHTLKVEIPPVPGEQNNEDNFKTATIEVREK